MFAALSDPNDHLQNCAITPTPAMYHPSNETSSYKTTYARPVLSMDPIYIIFISTYMT